MLFKELVKACSKAEVEEDRKKYEECHNILRDISSNSNIMMDVGKIKDFDDDITQQGDLKYHQEAKYKIYESQSTFLGRKTVVAKAGIGEIFVFEYSLIVCSKDTR